MLENDFFNFDHDMYKSLISETYNLYGEIVMSVGLEISMND